MIFSVFFKKIGFWGILDPPYCGIGATIRIGREMLCLPYAGFFLLPRITFSVVFFYDRNRGFKVEKTCITVYRLLGTGGTQYMEYRVQGTRSRDDIIQSTAGIGYR